MGWGPGGHGGAPGPQGHQGAQGAQGSAGSGSAGSPIVRKFPFAYNTPGLDTGAPLLDVHGQQYVPTVGDLLYEASVQTDVAFNGITPKFDFGTFVGVSNGLYGGAWAPVDLTKANAATDGEGMLQGQAGSVASGSNSLRDGIIYSYIMTNVSTGSTSQPVIGAGIGLMPITFTDPYPPLMVASTTGEIVRPATCLANVAPTLPLTIVLNVNDQFVVPGGSPDTFVIAPGVYTTLAAVVTAMGAAVSTAMGEGTYAANYAAPSADGTKILLTSLDTGSAGNSGQIGEGNGGAAALGFTSNPNSFSGGSGGDPGSTQGSGILYLVTATPV